VFSGFVKKGVRRSLRSKDFMKMKIKLLILLALITTFATGKPIRAQDKAIKIAFISTLSGPGGALGVDALDGFNLALKDLDKKFGDVAVEVISSDDQQNPDIAKQAVEKALQKDKVDFVTGIIFSNILLAVGNTIFDTQTYYISLNAGPSQYAGEMCNPFFFNVAWQNDNLHETMGKYVNDKGFKNVYILAPNYPAGKDALTGFKRFYTGNLADEVYTKLNQLDFAAELAQIRASNPDAVYTFQPGGSGINFIKQYADAGLLKDIPLFVPGFSADQDVIKAVGEPMVGLFNSSHWTLELDNAENKKFVEDFQKEYKRIPSLYASQGYDAAMLLNGAVKDVKGDVSDKNAVRKALEAATFKSVRGDFKFNTNHYPIQNYYLRQVIKNDQGQVLNKQVATIFENHKDAYADKCQMKPAQ
jgi:branched-chain amino acid transport system substrate-binding protein